MRQTLYIFKELVLSKFVIHRNTVNVIKPLAQFVSEIACCKLWHQNLGHKTKGRYIHFESNGRVSSCKLTLTFPASADKISSLYKMILVAVASHAGFNYYIPVVFLSEFILVFIIWRSFLVSDVLIFPFHHCN